MFRSLANRSLPKPLAIAVSLLLGVAFVPVGALSASAAGDADIFVYDQCYTGDPPVGGQACAGWTNGILNDSNSDYNEDEVTPQRLVLDFNEAGSHTIDISYLTFDHNVHAYDSLATWNHTRTGADRCQGFPVGDSNCVGGAASTFPIPPDSTVHHDVGVGVSPIVSNHQLPGQVLTMYGGSITGAAYRGMGTYGPDYQTLRVTLTAAANSKVMLLFGGHIAATFGPRGWGERANGNNLGAAQVPGGSYHIRITDVNGKSPGNRDNQLMSGAIEPPSETAISTNATAGPVTIGGSITDTATVTPSNAVGTVNFAVYGPNDATCSGPVVFSSNNRPVVSGTATSAAFTPTAVGTYRWIASFTPTDPTKFDAVAGACNDANESSVIAKRQPAISTDAQDSATLPNASISDTATVTNLTSDATGTVTFNLYGPGDTTCANSIWTNPKPLGTVTSNSATVSSDSHVVTQAGTYRWIAAYSGDAKNQAVSGQCNDPNESTVVNKAPATITTDAQDTAKLPDATITDTATLAGVTSNAGGEIIFKLYGPDATPGTPTCTEGDGGNLVFTSASGAFPVTGPGTYGPASVEVDKAGVYFWIATYTGDANNLGVSGVCGDPTETSDVDKASPTISTSATDGTLPGATIHDTATVQGLTSDATGTVAFSLWDNATCTGAPVFTDTKPLGTVTSHQASVTSASFTVTNAGDYNWVASYSGDSNNDAATGACGDEGETSTVNPATPSISTSATNAQLPAGTIHDVATVSGLTAHATGTVTFKLWSNPNCDGTAVFTDTKALGSVTAGVATVTSANFTPTAAGNYYWIASYSGDANNVAVAGTCGDEGETSTVTKAAPTIATLADASATLPAGTLSDTATLSGLTTNATGTVIFRLYGPDATPGAPTCDQGSLAFSSAPIAIVNNGDGTATAESGNFTPTAAGTYFWIASYSGDANNADVSGACGDENETSTVNRAVTTIVTAATDAQLPAGTIHDVATVSGLTSTATGTVRFDLWNNATCTGAPIFTDTKSLGAVTAGAATVTSANYTPTAAGDYHWIAFYSGDANNLATQGACGDEGETSTVTKAAPAIATLADVSAALPDGTLSDTASLSGLTSDATGTVTFRLYGPDTSPIVPTCDVGTLAFTSSAIPIVSNGSGTATADSGNFTPTKAGAYFWIATYSGDANNDGVAGVCGDQGERSDVDKASPTISTSATDGTLPGATIHDTATVQGLTSDATGTVEFRLWDNDNCSGAPVFTDTKPLGTVSAGQATATSASFTVTNAGDYNWVASYSGDSNNDAATGACGDEGETSTVNPATPSISTSATNAQLPAGTIHDVATVSGLTAHATGTVTFKLWSNPNCDGTAVFTDTKALGTVTAGVATVTSANFTPTAAGNYYWIASYSGDANNVAVAGDCGDEGETSTVTKAANAISTSATDAQLPAGTIYDVATVSGLTADATGTVTFDLWDNDECAGDAVFSSTEGLGTVTGGVATSTSAEFTPTAVGDYYWIATYSGDANNEGVSGVCGDEGETSTVTRADTTITTDAADEAPATQDGTGVVLTDTATLRGATSDAGGEITFTLYGPFDSLEDVSCEGEGTTVGEPVSVDGNDSYESDPVTVTEFGFYTWVAAYSGDANNEPADHACGLPAETVEFQPTLEKTADPASGGVVQPDGSIEYTVTVGNTGDIAITDATVTDTLPPFVTVDEASISDGGVFVAGSDSSVSAGTITWSVDLAAAGDEGDTVELTYEVTVDEDAPEGAVLVNRAVLFSLEDTTTHVVPTGDLTIVKAVTPVAGNGVVIHFGDTLTYTLNAVASGDLDQPDVVVTDYVPGFDPARPSSGKTTYVAGSAACVGAGDCTVTEPGTDGLITWELGDMAAGTSRQVTFKVTIDRPAALPDGAIPAVDVLNAGAVESTRTPLTPSNEVVTPVTEVLGVKVPKPPTGILPRTGALVPPAQLAGVAVLLFGLGLLLVAATRRGGRHRRG